MLVNNFFRSLVYSLRVRVLVTGAGGSAASNYCDSLSLDTNMNTEIIGVDSSPWMLPLSSISKKFLVPSPGGKDYLESINGICRDHQIDVVHAQPDVEVRALSECREHLVSRFFLPNHTEIALASDKFQLANLLNKSGIPSPETATGSTCEEFKFHCSLLLQSFNKLWVRARKGAGSRASLPITNVQQAVNWVEWWINEKQMKWTDFQISEFLPGKEFALQTIWQSGILISAEARVRVKYLYGFLSPSGQSSTPSVARTTTEHEVYEVGLGAIRALSNNPNGIYCVDMKTDSSNKIKVTEINVGRFFTTSNFFAHAGVNMPVLSIRAAMGEKLNPIPIASLGDDLYWIRMVDMGYKLVHVDELKAYAPQLNLFA